MDSPTAVTPRSQAGPLPSKAGELGYQATQFPDQLRTDSFGALPARHPADRDVEASQAIVSQDIQAEPPMATSKQKTATNLCGVRVVTLIMLLIQTLLIAGCAVAWYFAIQRLNQNHKAAPTDVNSPDSTIMAPDTIAILTHVAFTLAVIVQLVFLERRIFYMRAERYTYTHHGETLPTSRDSSNEPANLAMAFAPWNRPPLPTYASALAQSGYATGDVEDNVIAVAPPPAYGQTRSTKMLLQGHLRDSLRRARPVSVLSQNSISEDKLVRHDADIDADAIEIRDDAAVARGLERILHNAQGPVEPVTR